MTVALRAPANRVSRRAIAMWLFESLIGLILIVGVTAIVAAQIDGKGWSWVPDWLAANVWRLPVAVGLILAPLTLIEPFWRYAVHRWELTGDVIYARSGWINREWVFVPVSRVQTVDKQQGWLERLLGLATVEIRTASYAGSSSIKGLDYDVAARLAEDVARRAEELRDDAT
ncbi:PH domain-containing protein [Thermostaphylospora chromogena]|uniref:YdbS-like PH domain-containing protein n=1 Tax=Thermostaphylospora chromogena TaxID=35622 RepID=A0A1H1HYN5_9ACTN|nr:PH domain-containing protein [Thermostaphylospora chromogena]SDR30575.1 hypothetical protein SAMN04489764_4975 [Thermostaphylospora chromogena]